MDQQATAATPSKATCFSFGDPMPVMEGRDILDYAECWLNGRWYEPPVSFNGLAKAFRAGIHHSSAIYFKRNLLSGTFIPHKHLSRQAFDRYALETLTFGNGYLERKESRIGTTMTLEPMLSKYMRVGKDPGQYFMVHGWKKNMNSQPVRCSTCLSRTLTRKSTAYPNTSAPCSQPG